jgi:hypothetical protein
MSSNEKNLEDLIAQRQLFNAGSFDLSGESLKTFNLASELIVNIRENILFRQKDVSDEDIEKWRTDLTVVLNQMATINRTKFNVYTNFDAVHWKSYDQERAALKSLYKVMDLPLDSEESVVRMSPTYEGKADVLLANQTGTASMQKYKKNLKEIASRYPLDNIKVNLDTNNNIIFPNSALVVVKEETEEPCVVSNPTNVESAEDKVVGKEVDKNQKLKAGDAKVEKRRLADEAKVEKKRRLADEAKVEKIEKRRLADEAKEEEEAENLKITEQLKILEEQLEQMRKG